MAIHPSRVSLQIKFCRYCCHDKDWHENKTKMDYTVWNLEQGALVIEINHKIMTASSGDILFFHPGDTYTAYSADDCCNFLVTFFTYDDGNGRDPLTLHNSAGIYSGAPFRELSDSLCQTFFRSCHSPTTVPLQMYAQFLSFLSALFPYFGTQRAFHDQPGEPPALKINELLSWIDARVEQKIPVRELAAFMGMSEKYFIQFFHAHTGYSPKQYMIRRRMEHSAALLSDPALTVSQIAQILHFSDSYAFSKAFKKYYGESPGAFRKIYQKEPDKAHFCRPVQVHANML